MNISGEGLLAILLAGLIAGWLAGKIVASGGFGLIGDIAVGVVGALLGTWLLPRIGLHVHSSGFVGLIIVATIGAIILLLVIRLLSGGLGRRRWGSWRR